MDFFVSTNGLILYCGLAAIAFGIRAWRLTEVRSHAVVGSLTFLTGLVVTALIVLHLVAVLAEPFQGFGIDPAFEYDFRFYSLVLFGVLNLIPGFALIRHAGGVTRSSQPARRASIRACLIILALNAPLLPVQFFARHFTLAACVALLPLLVVRKWSLQTDSELIKD